MKEESTTSKKPEVSKKHTLVEITPLKDHEILFNELYYDIKKGEKIKVAEMFLPNLKTEKVIK